MHFTVLFDFQPGSAHIGEAFHSFCEVFDDFICIAVLDAVAHAVLDMALEDNLSYFMKCRFYRIDLRQDILARHILIHPYGRSPMIFFRRR